MLSCTPTIQVLGHAAVGALHTHVAIAQLAACLLAERARARTRLRNTCQRVTAEILVTFRWVSRDSSRRQRTIPHAFLEPRRIADRHGLSLLWRVEKGIVGAPEKVLEELGCGRRSNHGACRQHDRQASVQHGGKRPNFRVENNALGTCPFLMANTAS